MAAERRVKGYPRDPEQVMEILDLETHQYVMPFNYKNVTVFRKEMQGSEFHGVELMPFNMVTSIARAARCRAGEWFQLKTSFVVPPPLARGVPQALASTPEPMKRDPPEMYIPLTPVAPPTCAMVV